MTLTPQEIGLIAGYCSLCWGTGYLLGMMFRSSKQLLEKIL